MHERTDRGGFSLRMNGDPDRCGGRVSFSIHGRIEPAKSPSFARRHRAHSTPRGGMSPRLSRTTTRSACTVLSATSCRPIAWPVDHKRSGRRDMRGLKRHAPHIVSRIGPPPRNITSAPHFHSIVRPPTCHICAEPAHVHGQQFRAQPACVSQQWLNSRPDTASMRRVLSFFDYRLVEAGMDSFWSVRSLQSREVYCESDAPAVPGVLAWSDTRCRAFLPRAIPGAARDTPLDHARTRPLRDAGPVIRPA